MSAKLNKKAFLRSVSVLMSISVIVGAGLLSGCAAREASTDTSEVSGKDTAVNQEDSQAKIMAELTLLLGKSPKADEVIGFIDKNISQVSKEYASAMLSGLEATQKGGLPELEKKYFKGNAIQNKLSKVYKPGFDINKLEDIKDNGLKDLLAETRDMGFKIETAEGSYFPIMNYEFYKKYSTYVTADMKDYIDIMAVETSKVPAKDAALVIGWEEVIKRASAQEKFIRNHENSAKLGDMKELHKKYLTFMLYGLNNTPLFSYDKKVMDDDAKEVYLEAVKNSEDSSLIKLLGEYMDLLKKTEYKLTDEVEKFRKEAVKNAI